MKHYGDITKLSGWTLPIVDVITGGSPCQDLSVAGKRAGLAGERSGLFMEQIRIVNEMRERDRVENGRTGFLCRPRFMVWENVPGAFSSNGGKDFQAVLEEIVRVVEENVPDLRTVVQGGWTKSGCLYDEMGAWSVAWRVHDAQFWGVPQRRKRIALVADFGGLAAPEILFERKGLRRDSEPSGEARERTAEGTESGADRTICLQGNGIDRADTAGCNGAGWRRGGSYTLNTIDRPAVMAFKQGQGAKAGGIGAQEECSPTLAATESGTNQVPALMCGNPWDSQSERVYHGDGAWHSINSNSSGGQSRNAIVAPKTARSLTARMDGSPCVDRGPEFVVTAVDCRNGTENGEVNGCLQAKESGGTSLNLNNVVRVKTS